MRALPPGGHDNRARSGSRPPVLSGAGLLVLAVGTFTLGVDGYVLSGLLPQVAADLHVPVSTAGQLTTVFAVVYAVGSPLIAALSGSWDRRTLLAAGMAVFLVGMAMQATGPVFAVVAGGRVLAALGAAAFQATAYATAGLLSDDQRRARSLAVVAAGSSLALVIGLPFGILLGQVWGWRSAVWLLTALAAVTGCAVRLLPAVRVTPLSVRDRIRVLADRRVRQILIGTVTVLVPGFLVVAYLPTTLHASGRAVVTATLAFGCGQVLSTSAVPRLVRLWGAYRTLLLAAGTSTIAAVTLIVSRQDPLTAAGSLAVLGAGVGLAVVPQQHRLFAMLPDLAPVAVGLNGSAIYAASALGAGIGGATVELAGDAALAPAAAVIGMLATVSCAVLVPERGRTAARRSRRAPHDDSISG